MPSYLVTSYMRCGTTHGLRLSGIWPGVRTPGQFIFLRKMKSTSLVTDHLAAQTRMTILIACAARVASLSPSPLSDRICLSPLPLSDRICAEIHALALPYLPLRPQPPPPLSLLLRRSRGRVYRLSAPSPSSTSTSSRSGSSSFTASALNKPSSSSLNSSSTPG